MRTKLHSLFAMLALLAASTFNEQLGIARAQGTAFTYAGQLQDNGSPASGTYNLAFTLFTNNIGEAAIAGPVITNGVTVANGLFAVLVDFGPGAFTGQSAWLEVAVETNGASGFTTLSPRQQLRPTPYAIFAETSGSVNLPYTGTNAVIIYAGTNWLLYDDEGNANFFSGVGAGKSTTKGIGNTAVGSGGALALNTEGYNNTAVGTAALESNTNGNDNTAIGYQALNANTNGISNTATGDHALLKNTSGNWNTANGVGALYTNTSGSYNTANGANALQNSNEGSFNTANGVGALQFLTSGSHNTADGVGALDSLTDRDLNIALGRDAGYYLTTGSYNIYIGNADNNSAESGIIRIGTAGAQTNTFIAGIYDATAAGGSAVYVDSNGQLGTRTSSRRYKKDIRSMGDASDVLLSLRPVTFRYKPEIDPNGIPQFGLVAEEVDEVDPDLVVRDERHGIYTVRYETVNAMLLNEFQKEHSKVEQQTSQIQALKEKAAKVDSLEKRVADLEQVLRSLIEKE